MILEPISPKKPVESMRNLTWARYCKYCRKIIKQYTYIEVLYTYFEEEPQFCNERHKFLYSLNGGKKE
jgi:hypothetical protein